MNTNTRTTAAESKTRGSRLNNPQVGEIEIPMSDTSADLHDIWLFFGMGQKRLQDLWDLCQGVDRHFYRQKVAEMAEIARTMRRHTNGRTS